LARQASRNDDRGINELLSTSISELFPDDHKSGKLDENTQHTQHTLESTERDLSEDEYSDINGDYFQKILSYEQDENGDARVTDVTDEDTSESLKFGDVFPEYQPGIDDSFVDLEESFAQVASSVQVRHLRIEQRKKVIKAFFGPMKAFMKPVKSLPTKIQKRIGPIHLPEINFRNNKRKLTRVTFAEIPTFVVDEIDESEDMSSEEFESTWYNDEDYDAWKKSVLLTMEQIVLCHLKNNEFEETDEQTARGLESVTKEMIIERKQYKISSRHTVFDEQEEQRVSRMNNPERIRNLYIEATSKAKDLALENGWKDQEAVHKLNGETFCIEEEDSNC